MSRARAPKVASLLPPLLLPLLLPLLAGATPVPAPDGRLVLFPSGGAQRVAEAIAPGAEAEREAVAADLGRDWAGVTEVQIAVDEASFRALLPGDEPWPAWRHGATLPAHNRIVLLAGTSDDETRRLLRRHLTLLAAEKLAPGALPRWLFEGLAAANDGARWSSEAPSVVRASMSGRLFRLDALTDAFPATAPEAQLAHAESADFVAWLVSKHGEVRMRALLRDVVSGQSFEQAVQRNLGADIHQLEHDWSLGLARWELAVRFLTQPHAWWLALALLMCIAALRLRARRLARLEELRAEEEEQRRILAELPAVWADADEEDEQTTPAAPEDPARRTADDDLDELDLADDATDDLDDEAAQFLARPGSITKKPTLH
jgi:hypothetical protein